jgi:hypothetical protein
MSRTQRFGKVLKKPRNLTLAVHTDPVTKERMYLDKDKNWTEHPLLAELCPSHPLLPNTKPLGEIHFEII